MAKTYNLFISHSWTYGDAYQRLIGLLDAAPNFSYRNYSVPKDDPVHDADNVQELYDAIKAKVTFCQVVIIMAGKYATYSKWIQREIRIAQVDFDKPVLGVESFGADQVSSTVREAADKLVKWNTSSIVAGIREIAL